VCKDAHPTFTHFGFDTVLLYFPFSVFSLFSIFSACPDRAARAMGFDGKTLIHPSQIATANAIFAPSPDALQHAREIIAAHTAALREGLNVAVVRGKLVENLHVADAQRALGLHEAICQLETAVS